MAPKYIFRVSIGQKANFAKYCPGPHLGVSIGLGCKFWLNKFLEHTFYLRPKYRPGCTFWLSMAPGPRFCPSMVLGHIFWLSIALGKTFLANYGIGMHILAKNSPVMHNLAKYVLGTHIWLIIGQDTHFG